MGGRLPKAIINGAENHKSKTELSIRLDKTPACTTQEFKPPKTLNEKEKKVWKWLVKIFRETTACIISDADVHTMEAYCQAKVAYDEACEKWNEDQRLYIAIGGTVKTNQWYVIKRDFFNILLKTQRELGLSPTGRAKQGIAATKSKKENDQAKIFNFLNRKDK